MSINTQKSRERIKRSTLTGVVPTVPVSADFTDGTWLNTDIRAGEFFYNIPDEKLWIGTNTVPLELTSGIANTLAQILTNGNTTGGSDIIITSGDLIRDSSSKAILGLDPSYTALYYKDTNATPNESILQYNPDNSVVGIEGDQYSVALINRRSVGGATQHFNGLYIGNMTYDLKSPFLGLGLTGALLVTTNSLISAGVFNSAIIGGDNNQIIAGSGNILSGTTNINTLGDNNIISGDTNINTLGDNNIISGGLNTNSGSGNYISGANNTNSGSGNYISGGLNTNSGIYSIISGYHNTITSGDCSIICGKDNTITSGVYNIICGKDNTISVGSYNIISGYHNTISVGSNNIISGQNNQHLVMGNCNIIGGKDNINSSGFRNLIVGETNSTININGNNVIGGSNNNLDASFGCIIGGDSNIISAGSNYNFISGDTNIITLGSNNIISGQGNEILNNISNSLLVGSNNIMLNPGIMYGIGGITVVSNGFSNAYVDTTNATPTLLTTDGTNSFKINIDVTYRVELTLLVKDIATGDAKEWKGFGIIKNVAGTTSLVGGTLSMISSIGDVSLATATVAVTANNTTDCLDITVTGIAATNLLWNCGIEYVLVNG